MEMKVSKIQSDSKILQKQDNSKEDDLNIIKSAILEVLIQYANNMRNFNVDINEVKDLLITYGKKYSVNYERIFNIIIEFQILQTKSNENIKKENKIMKKHEKLLKNYKNNFVHTIIILTIPYLSDKELRNILLLNKTVHEITKLKIFRVILLNNKLPNDIHTKIWDQIINLVLLKITIEPICI